MTTPTKYPPAQDGAEVLLRLREDYEQDGSPEAGLVWMALVSSLRVVSEAGTAPWQYVLPGRRKTVPPSPEITLHKAVQMIAADIRFMARRAKPLAKLRVDDARKCVTVPDSWATLVITSPPYANNYDYADATRLEMAFMGEIRGWGDLQETVRRHLVRACSQHVPPNSVNLDEVLAAPELAPIRDEIVPVCRELSSVRMERGGKKTYNNMIACYFLDMAQTWKALRRVCASPSEVCFVIGDSAPYGVYVPVIEWLGKLALAAGFESWTFEKLRDRNIKWKNRKHQPFCGAVLAGEFTRNALQQLESKGFGVLHIPYNSILAAFRELRIDASSEDGVGGTTEEQFREKITKWESRPQPQAAKRLLAKLHALHHREIADFKQRLEAALTRRVSSIRLTVLRGHSVECSDIESAIAYLIEEAKSYRLREDGEQREAFEVQVRFNTGARIEAAFPKRAEAIAFLRTFENP